METNIIKGLEKGLSETYMQHVNIQKCHWNVEGPRFHSLHVMFEGQYQKLGEYIDVLAERIRALDAYAPGSFSEFLDQSEIPEIKPRKVDADEMIRLVVSGYATLVTTLQQLANVASKNGDPETEDIVIGMNEVHQKNMWMLRSIMSDKA